MPATTTRPATILKGLTALAGILAILVGIPTGLWVFGGNPLPQGMPAWGDLVQMLTSDTDGTLFLGTLKLLGWVGWASLALPLLLDIITSILRMPTPEIPGLSWQQGRAAALTGAVAAMMAFGGVGAANAATIHATTAPLAASSTRTAPAGDIQAHTTHARSNAPSTGHDRQVVVQPGDTLSQIAQDQLGDADLYNELFAASKPIVQPDGRHLSDPSVIFPGDRIVIPSAASTPHQNAPTRPTLKAGASSTAAAPQHPSARSTPPSHPLQHRAATPSTSVPSTARSSATPPPDNSSARTSMPPRTSPSTPAASPHPTDSTPPVADAATTARETLQDDTARRVTMTTAGLGSLAAAGLLLALRRRREGHSRHRRPGFRAPTPTGASALTEAQLRAAADPLSTEHLDRALRTLAMHARELDAPLPELRAARISTDTLELYLTDADAKLPTPFQESPDDPGTWTLHRSYLDVLLSTADAATIPAPYPALVSLGIDEGNAHLLINLEQIGSLALNGTPTDCREVLTALAIELITSTWTDDSRITLVGILPELAHALGSDRATYVDQLDDILTSLAYTTSVTRQALVEAGHRDATAARVAGEIEDVWSPHLLLIGTQMSATERARVQEVLATVPRVAVATITAGGEPLGDWSIQLSRHEDSLQGVIEPAGIGVTPQHLPLESYRATLGLFEQAEEDWVPGPSWTKSLSDPVTASALPTQSSDFPLDGDPESEDLHAKAAAQARYLPTAIPAYPVAASTTPRSTSALDAGNESIPAQPHVEHELVEQPGRSKLTEDAPVAPSPAAATEGTDQGLDAQDPDGNALLRDAPAPAQEPAPIVASLPVDVDEVPAIELPSLPDDAPVIRLLGPVAVLNAPGTKPRSPARITELVAYLALHPGRSVEAFNSAIFPGERPDGGKLGEKRNGYVRQARSWLGHNPEGRPYVGMVQVVGYALDPTTAIDWAIFQDLVGSDIASTATVMLEAALRLVDGQPLSGVDASRYLWALADQSEMINTIADVAHELATRALNAGDSRTATWAADKGILVEPVSEALWRDKISAAYQSGNREKLSRAIEQMHAHLDPVTGDLEDETRDLIATVLSRQPAGQPLHV